MNGKISDQQAKELMRRYAATMRDDKETDLSKLRAKKQHSQAEQKAPKKKISFGARYAIIAACSCVLVLAIVLPVVFSGSLFAAEAPSASFDSKDMPAREESLSVDDFGKNKSSASSKPQQDYVAFTDTFRLIAPGGNTVTYELLPAEERPNSADSADNNVGLQADILYSIVEWIVFTDKNGLIARVYIARTQEKKARYEKTYDSSVSFGTYRLQYEITSNNSSDFSAQGKIESDDETIYIEYSKTGGDLESFRSWVNAAVSTK